MPPIKQLSLPGFRSSSPWKENLFFALFPDTKTAACIYQRADEWRRELGLTGKLLQPERLHVSLHCLGQYTESPNAIIRSACEAARTLVSPRFEVAFDLVASFNNRTFNRPLVLFNRNRDEKLNAFRRALVVALAARGLIRYSEGHWNPHVTLLYDNRRVDVHSVDMARWTVREFALVRSLVGRTQYVEAGRWQLSAWGDGVKSTHYALSPRRRT